MLSELFFPFFCPLGILCFYLAVELICYAIRTYNSPSGGAWGTDPLKASGKPEGEFQGGGS